MSLPPISKACNEYADQLSKKQCGANAQRPRLSVRHLHTHPPRTVQSVNPVTLWARRNRRTALTWRRTWNRWKFLNWSDKCRRARSQVFIKSARHPPESVVVLARQSARTKTTKQLIARFQDRDDLVTCRMLASTCRVTASPERTDRGLRGVDLRKASVDSCKPNRGRKWNLVLRNVRSSEEKCEKN